MKKNSGNILLAVLVAIGVVVASVGGYFYLWPKFRYPAQDIQCVDDNQCPPEYYCYKNPENKDMFYLGGPGKCVKGQRQLQMATPLDNPTANWKTYTNSSDGYTIKYPANYSVSEVPPDYVRFSPGFNDPKGPQSQTYLSIQLDLKPDPSKNPAAIYKTTPDGRTLRISQIMMGLDENQKLQVQVVFDQILAAFKFLGQTSDDPRGEEIKKLDQCMPNTEMAVNKCRTQKTKDNCLKMNPDCSWVIALP